jgi:hypothetical protein
MKVKLILSVLLLLGWLTACGSSAPPSVPPAPTPTPIAVAAQNLPSSTPTTAPAPTGKIVVTLQATQLPVSPILDTPSPAQAPTEAAVEAQPAPRLIVPSAEGLMAVDADGARTQLFGDAQFSIGRGFNVEFAPHHGQVAFIGGDNPMTPDREGSGPLTLFLLDTQAGTVRPITPLFSSEMAEALTAAQSGERTAAVEAGIAVAEMPDTLAWSPDGRYLAFIAAIDGPSSDVYTYDRVTGQINRLTDGPNQAVRLFWSPDSQWIVHEEVESFGTGAGYNVRAAWAAAPDGSGTRKLYDVSRSGDEVFVEWVSPETFIVYSWSAIGLQSIRLVNLATGDVQRLGPDFPVQAYAVAPQSQTQLYVVDDYTAQQNGLTGGLYLDTIDAPPQLVASGDWYNVQWRPNAELFFAHGAEGVMSVALDGAVQNWTTERATLPIDSPDGAWLLAWGDGNFTSPIGLRLYTADGELKRTITSGSVTSATWSPASAGVFYVSEGDLYYAAIPNGEPELIAENLATTETGSLGWVMP